MFGRLIKHYYYYYWSCFFFTFMQYLIAICSLPEAASDVMSHMFMRMIVSDNGVKFCDPNPRLNRFRKIRPKVERKYLANDVISDVDVQ